MIKIPEYDKHFTKVLGNYQKERFTKALGYCIRKNTAIDIGAHIGHWAHNMKQHFKNVHCFEPVPDNYVCLLANVPGINYYPVALLDKPGNFKLYLESQKNSGSWTAFPQNESTSVTSVNVKVKTLDSYNFQPDFIKMDVQDCELFILRGGENTLRKHKPVLCLESATNKFRKEIHDFLNKLSYNMVGVYGKEEIFVSN